MKPSYADAGAYALTLSGAICLALSLCALGCEFARLYNSRAPAILLVSVASGVLLLGFALYWGCRYCHKNFPEGSSVKDTTTQS